MILVCIGMVVGAMIMCGGLFVGGLCMSARLREDYSSNLTAGMPGGVLTDSRAEKLIDEVMREFNFERVSKTMQSLDWRWAITSSGRIPSLAEIRTLARQLLLDAIERKGLASTGGFEASYSENPVGPSLKLRFIVEEWRV